MATPQTARNTNKSNSKGQNLGHLNNKQILMKITQLNLQHSRSATDNLMNLTKQEHTDILLIQEPYLIQNKLVGITRSYRTYKTNEDKGRAAIVIANDSIDALLIKQLSDRDTTVIEVRNRTMQFIVVSMYLDMRGYKYKYRKS
jgi:exonuclease III